MSAWLAFVLHIGRAARISSPSQPSRCGRPSSITHGAIVPENVAVVRKHSRSKTRPYWCQETIKNKDVDVVALDDALNALAGIDARKAQVAELRFFGGLNFD